MLHLYYDEKNIVRMASTRPIVTNLFKFVEVDKPIPNPIGKKLIFGAGNPSRKMRLAIVCNWDDACGIATYTKYLVDALASKVDELKIFSEKTPVEKVDGNYNVSCCWKRGESLRPLARQIREWQPSVVLIQHEYGIFPKTGYFVKLLEQLHEIPYVVTMHSVYEHLDKTVASSAMRNIIVHTETGKACLRRLGNRNNIWVIPHGCVVFDDPTELWNTWQMQYPIVQFGFGFSYKGVDVALDALALMRKRQPSKYREVFYTYFCSENKHVRNVIDGFARSIQKKIDDLGLHDNAAIVRGFQSEETLNNVLRTSRMAIFPYVTDPKNVVYGASGAIRVAMANGIPVVASASHMFDDMEGVLPRPRGAEELADTIDKVFSQGDYRQGILDRSAAYINEYSWPKTADTYLSVLQQVRDGTGEDVIFV